jgi:hypothetical protein
MKSWSALASLALLSLWVSSAQATKTYPAEIVKHYGVDALPVPGDGCTLCHKNDEGGANTINTTYGRAMMTRYEVRGANLPSLRAGLDAADAAGQDSDRDGTPDAEELMTGTNPNTVPATEPGMPEMPAVVEGNDVPLPQTGCNLRAPGERRHAPGPWVSALALVAAVCCWRRRSSLLPKG